MDLAWAFNELQQTVNVPKGADVKARERRDLFRDAFDGVDGVTQIIPSGSLARGSQIDPINDVDLVMLFDAEDHPEWGDDGDSAEEALNHAKDLVRQRLGSSEGERDCPRFG